MIVIDYKGNRYPSIKSMCDAYNILPSIYTERVNKYGWTQEAALNTPVKQRTVTDHKGIVYSTTREMCDAYGVPFGTYQSRRRAGWTLEESLRPVEKTTGEKACTDHLGNHYPSITLMCAHYGIPKSVYAGRIKLGWNLEEALTTPVGGTRATADKVEDHLGNRYPSISAMCKAYGISISTYEYRRGAGRSLEEALKGYIRVTDHKGQEYPSVSAMCRAYGISYEVYRDRIRRGMSLEEALTTPLRKTAKDHKGVEYPSVAAMCNAYGIPRVTYNARLRYGWSLERALTTPVGRTEKAVTDHKGTEYPSVAAMCKAYGISRMAYDARRRQGWTLEEALTKPVEKKR